MGNWPGRADLHPRTALNRPMGLTSGLAECVDETESSDGTVMRKRIEEHVDSFTFLRLGSLRPASRINQSQQSMIHGSTTSRLKSQTDLFLSIKFTIEDKVITVVFGSVGATRPARVRYESRNDCSLCPSQQIDRPSRRAASLVICGCRLQ
jgi:hypothetical protein